MEHITGLRSLELTNLIRLVSNRERLTRLGLQFIMLIFAIFPTLKPRRL
jgi:hypothetical protein